MCECQCERITVPTSIDPEKPEWFHPGGLAVHVGEHGEKKIVLTSAWTFLMISTSSVNKDHFEIQWSVRHAPGEAVNGTVQSSREMLMMAFGLAPAVVTPCVRAFIERYDADFAVLGGCIKRGDYLNIPGPGTGYWGDPNISILVTPEIRKEVALFLNVEV